MLEAESIHIMREVVAEFERPVMLYSIGKDSSVLLRLAQKAFYPGPDPVPAAAHRHDLQVPRDDRVPRPVHGGRSARRLIVHTNTEAIADGTQPFAVGTQRCCGLLKTKALLDALEAGNFDAAFGGARRDEERSRAKERIFSLRDEKGQWDPKRQRPELWHLLNGRHPPGREHPRVPAVELDRARRLALHPRRTDSGRPAVFRQGARGHRPRRLADHARAAVRAAAARRKAAGVMCRMRSLGCSPCTGAVRSDADTVPKIIEELVVVRHSERQLRVIDHDQDGSMELKKREGYF